MEGNRYMYKAKFMGKLLNLKGYGVSPCGDRLVRLNDVFKAVGESSIAKESLDLQRENEKLRVALANMWFAYVNSDKESPHFYEKVALKMAEKILGPWENVMPESLQIKTIMKYMPEVYEEVWEEEKHNG